MKIGLTVDAMDKALAQKEAVLVDVVHITTKHSTLNFGSDV